MAGNRLIRALGQEAYRGALMSAVVWGGFMLVTPAIYLMLVAVLSVWCSSSIGHVPNWQYECRCVQQSSPAFARLLDISNDFGREPWQLLALFASWGVFPEAVRRLWPKRPNLAPLAWFCVWTSVATFILILILSFTAAHPLAWYFA